MDRTSSRRSTATQPLSTPSQRTINRSRKASSPCNFTPEQKCKWSSKISRSKNSRIRTEGDYFSSRAKKPRAIGGLCKCQQFWAGEFDPAEGVEDQFCLDPVSDTVKASNPSG